jgi:hypothetical protein
MRARPVSRPFHPQRLVTEQSPEQDTSFHARPRYKFVFPCTCVGSNANRCVSFCGGGSSVMRLCSGIRRDDPPNTVPPHHLTQAPGNLTPNSREAEIHFIVSSRL